jgi:hypothetical protein
MKRPFADILVIVRVTACAPPPSGAIDREIGAANFERMSYDRNATAEVTWAVDATGTEQSAGATSTTANALAYALHSPSTLAGGATQRAPETRQGY